MNRTFDMIRRKPNISRSFAFKTIILMQNNFEIFKICHDRRKSRERKKEINHSINVQEWKMRSLKYMRIRE